VTGYRKANCILTEHRVPSRGAAKVLKALRLLALAVPYKISETTFESNLTF